MGAVVMLFCGMTGLCGVLGTEAGMERRRVGLVRGAVPKVKGRNGCEGREDYAEVEGRKGGAEGGYRHQKGQLGRLATMFEEAVGGLGLQGGGTARSGAAGGYRPGP